MKILSKSALFLFFIVLGILAVRAYIQQYKQKPSVPENTKLQITTSFYPLYFFASKIGRDKADVVNITPSGAEPHDYEPTARDIAHLEKSNLIILNGARLESWADKIKNNVKKQTVVVMAGEKLAVQKLDEDDKVLQDPHVWLDPNLVMKEVEYIRDGFIKVDPKNKEYYSQNAINLISQLESLDKEYRSSLLNCTKKDIITSHAAFGYLATSYGLHQVPISGLSPEEEPSSKQLAEVANFAKKNSVKYIFFESLVSPKLAETIANEVGAKTLVLNPLEGLTNTQIEKGENYFSIMRTNLTNLKTALECK